MTYLTIDQLLSELDRRPGLIPVEIEVAGRRLAWVDFETYHFYEGFFHKALDGFISLKESLPNTSPVARFVSDLEVLHDDRVVVDSIYPAGFIFHAGRCGSTLLAKVLARDRRNLVISEAPTHNQIWLALTGAAQRRLKTTEENKRVYRRLLLAVGRRRLLGHRAHFIKFTSFNILFFDFIRSAFPDVPAIFLYREPAAILASFEKNPPGWLRPDEATFQKLLACTAQAGFFGGNTRDSAAEGLAGLFAAGLRAGASGVRYLNYRDLTAGNLPVILDALRVEATEEELVLMQGQFKFDSKVEHKAAAFTATRSDHSRIASSQTELLDMLKQQYHQLVHSELNVVKAGGALQWHR